MMSSLNTEKLEQYINLIEYIYHCKARYDIYEVEKITDHVLSKEIWETTDGEIDFATNTENELLIRTSIKLGSEEILHYLIFTLSCENTLTIKNSKTLCKVIHLFAELVCSDHNNLTSLNGMAHELAVRYEELNIFYEIDSISQSLASESIDEEKTLKILANNCLEYLSVNFISLIVPNEELTITLRNNIAKSDEEIILDFLFKKAINKIQLCNETWVYNQNEVTDWLDSQDMIPYKFIISPIVSHNNAVSGILVLANTLTEPDFSNSDRKLCDVLAKEAGVVLGHKRDKLTGLINRSSFKQKIEKKLTLSDSITANYIFIQLNIDNFKIINDAVGYAAGDKLLQQVATLVQITAGENIILSRTGADEFSLLLEDKTLDSASELSNTIIKKVNETRFFHDDKIFEINLSVGILQHRNNLGDANEIMKLLELTSQSAKVSGGNRVKVYNSSEKEFVEQKEIMSGANRVTEALLNNRFILYAQEIKPLADQSLEKHYEVLIRMLDDYDNIIAPYAFIPSAEQYNMMLQLDQWVLDNLLSQLQEWRKHNDGNIVLSMNISGQTISDDRFTQYAVNKILNSGLPPEFICFEITETSAVVNITQAMKFINSLKKLGSSFALDDFGAGMSSFNYLKSLPVDYLKIDGCFVKDLMSNTTDCAMVESINNIGHVMNLKTIAEFVENSDIENKLKSIGVDYVQGYGIHKPEALSNLLQTKALIPSLKVASG
jgi:diguanylate cyclase (GGDEF)-like protein